jgi:hypothetical protein
MRLRLRLRLGGHLRFEESEAGTDLPQVGTGFAPLDGAVLLVG